MKKYISCGLCLSLIILLLSGCHNDKKVLKLKYNDFNVCVGNNIMNEPLCYLNLSELSDDEINSIRENAIMTMDKVETLTVHYDEESYICTIKYFDELVDFKIHVVRTLYPTILGPNIIAIKKGDKDFNFHKCFTFNTPYPIFDIDIDTTKINFNKVGDYPATVLISDRGGSKYQESRDIIVRVQNKVTYQIPQRIVLDIPYYNQLDAGAPNGCEATSLYMALKYKKKIDTDLKTFISSIPKASTPYEGFVGDPFSKATQIDDYFTIFPQALISATYKYAKMRDISGCDIEQMMDELANDHPVIIWGTGGFHEPTMENFYFGRVTRNLHVVLVNGYDKDKKVFYIKDPINKDLSEVSFDEFQTAYNAMKLAMIVE